MSFPSPPEAHETPEDSKRGASPPIVPPDAIEIPMNVDAAPVEKYGISEVLHALKTENLEKLAVMLCKNDFCGVCGAYLRFFFAFSNWNCRVKYAVGGM